METRKERHQLKTTTVHVHNISDTASSTIKLERVHCLSPVQTNPNIVFSSQIVGAWSKHYDSQWSKLVLAGPAEPMSYSMLGAINSKEQYKTNAQEVDSRIWRHCQQSHINKHYIFSPDTYLYNWLNKPQARGINVLLTWPQGTQRL